MIRSRRIPPLLCRICGDGIHSALLVTSDGELLGSYSTRHPPTANTPAPTNTNTPTTNNTTDTITTTTTTNETTTTTNDGVSTSSPHSTTNPQQPQSNDNHHTAIEQQQQQQQQYLDMSSIGALVSEVAGDYLKLGNELQLLDGAIPQPPTPPQQQQQQQGVGGGGGSGGPSSAASSSSNSTGVGSGSAVVGGKSGRASLKCLIVELDGGLVGVSSAGLDCYVAALADNTVEYGLLKARLMTLSMYVAEALSQLVEQP